MSDDKRYVGPTAGEQPKRDVGTVIAEYMAAPPSKLDAATVQEVLLSGNIARLSPEEKIAYYNRVCESLGLNPLTKPFEFLTLNGKQVFYALKSCTEQLRQIHGISLSIVSREVVEGCYVVTARAETRTGRTDESIGAVPIDGLKGEARSNAMMKGETKAKRRVTLSVCGLGMLDETEVESIAPSTKGQRQDRVIAPAAPAASIDEQPAWMAPDATLETDLQASVDAGQVEVIDAKTGEVTKKPRVTKPQLAKIHALKKEGRWNDSRWKEELTKAYGTDTSANLTKEQAGHWIEKLERKQRAADDPGMQEFVAEVTASPPAMDAGPAGMITFASPEQVEEIGAELKRLRWQKERTVMYLESTYKVKSIGGLQLHQATDFLNLLMHQPDPSVTR